MDENFNTFHIDINSNNKSIWGVTMKVLIVTIIGIMYYTTAFATLCNEHNPKVDGVPDDVKVFRQVHKVMCQVYKISEPYDFPETMQAIVWQESRAGELKTSPRVEKFDWASYGLMQLQPETVRWILTDLMGTVNVPDDATLIVRIKTDSVFSIHVAAVYFNHLYKLFVSKGFNSGTAWRHAVVAYNVGPTRLQKQDYDWDPNNYLDKIRKHIKLVKVYNEVYGIVE